MNYPILSLLVMVIISGHITVQAANPSFTIDYENDCFLKDGVEVQLVSGSIHYFRIHPTDWTDRIRKLRYAGFNTLELYVEWATHEKEIGQYDFSGANNVTDFILKAQEEGFMVLMRPGPYIDSERDMGGLPYWLMRENPDVKLRTIDDSYIKYVDAWYKNALLPMLKPLLYSNGGPIIMVQVSNEYGSYPACDYAYTSHMRDLVREGLGSEVLLYTTDGNTAGWLQCGKVPEVYATIDFGTGANVTQSFEIQRLFEPRGPLVNSEFYPGWLDHWSEPHNTIPAQTVATILDEMLAMKASVNMYVAHGGTNFGLTAGSNLGGTFQACPTSYDYDAPISEAGDLTEKYWAVRDVIGKYLTLPDMTPPPTNSSKFAYGDVTLQRSGGILDLANGVTPMESVTPLTFEAMSLFNGLAIYETTVPENAADPAVLKFKSVNDRGYVYLDGELVGLLAREQKAFSVPISARKGQVLTIIVEGQGRICYGGQINDFKGIIGNVTLGSMTLGPWLNTPLDLETPPQVPLDVHKTKNDASATINFAKGEMTFYSGSFTIQESAQHPQDTFLRVDGWTKGIAYVNNFSLGRYWPVAGPQLTLYVPHGVLRTGQNDVTLLELENAPCVGSAASCVASFTIEHVIDANTPQA